MPKADASRTKQVGYGLRRAVLYARVSSKEQEREGFSIPAQLKLLQDYAAAQGIVVVEEYVDIETAKQSGRASFGDMVRYLRRHPTVDIVLVEKTDRLYRNLKDWVTLDEIEAEIHFVKEGTVLSADSRSSEKFMHGIKVLMAKNYIDNLSEESRKGMLEKAAQGIWPTVAPLGYLNVMGPDGKRVIEVDPETAPIIAQMFHWYASGRYSLKEVSRMARDAGLVSRKGRNPVPLSVIHKVLRNPIYAGTFLWLGRTYKGIHEAIIPRELWERVQGVMDGRFTSNLRGTVHNLMFSGLVTCKHCGCALVGEVKKGKYVYYHCTGFKGKCKEPYVREEVLVEQFKDLLAGLQFDDDVLAWVTRALRESIDGEKREQREAMERLQKEADRMQRRLDALYIDRLDGKIDKAFYERMLEEWREERDRCLALMERQREADDFYLDDGVDLLKLASEAHRLFDIQAPEQKTRLLNLLLSNSTWGHGRLHATFRQPFDFLQETNAIWKIQKAAGGSPNGFFDEWLPGPDSNQRPIG